MANEKKVRTHGKTTCSFCGDKFRSTKKRFQHAKDCTERLLNRKK